MKRGSFLAYQLLVDPRPAEYSAFLAGIPYIILALLKPPHFDVTTVVRTTSQEEPSRSLPQGSLR